MKKLVDKKRLVKGFCDLAKIKSPSGREDEIADFLVKRLKQLEISVKKDGYGNLIARFEGSGKPLILCAHMDTVPVGSGLEIKPIVKDKRITSDGNTILGADNKDSIAAILEAITVIKENKLAHRAVEIVFTREEEEISKGAKNLDLSLLSGKECIISDMADPYGLITVSAPYCFKFEVRVKGRRSHVKEPENGVNAIAIMSKAISKMPLGRVDRLTTSNIAFAVSGLDGVITNNNLRDLEKECRNTVPDYAVIFGEVRGADIEKVQATLAAIKKHFSLAAKHFGGEVIFGCEKLADGYLFNPNDPLISMISEIFRMQGVKPKMFNSTGGSDANILNGRGIKSVVISSAHMENHKTTEYVVIGDLVKLADFYVRLLTK